MRGPGVEGERGGWTSPITSHIITSHLCCLSSNETLEVVNLALWPSRDSSKIIFRLQGSEETQGKNIEQFIFDLSQVPGKIKSPKGEKLI